jgi:hypothetical protein
MTEGITGISSAAVNEISAALAKAQSEVGTVVKNQEAKAGTFSYKYAGLDAVYEAIRAAAAKNGLAIIQRFADTSLHTVISHSSGQWIDFGLYPLGTHQKHQERGSAITYARRYTISCVFGIAPEEDDDGATGNAGLGAGKPDAKSFFRTAALRKEFCTNVLKAVDEALTPEALDAAILRPNINDGLAGMQKSGNEYDRVGLDEIERRIDTKKESFGVRTSESDINRLKGYPAEPDPFDL